MNYLVEKTVKGHRYRYWQPKEQYVVGGKVVDCPFQREPLTLDDDGILKAMQLNDALEKWRTGDSVEQPCQAGTVGWLIAEYKKDDRFKTLRDSTQALYLHHLKLLEHVFHDIKASEVSRLDAREFYKDFMGTKRKASMVVQISRVIFSFGRDIGVVTSNPFEDMRVPKAKARRVIIPKETIEAAKAKAIEMGLKSIAYAIQIAYDGGQRPGDIRMLPRGNYDGQWLRVTQSKTGAVVDIPVFKLPVLKGMLDALDHASTLILHEERTGNPYSKDMLCRRVREVFEAIGVGHDIQFRDLRRTAVVRLAEAGCSVPEICAITGHSLKEATEILEVYLPRSRQMAENAIDKVAKLETHQPTRKK